MEIISEDKLKYLSGKYKFNITYLEKDFYLTYLLYLIKDIKDLYFKGGTALYKIFMNNIRLSEDLDFTVTGDLREIEKEIREIIKQNNIFKEVKNDKRVENFTRLLVHYKKGSLIIDLNKRANVYLKTEEHELIHFYLEFIPKFKINTINIKELIAEKICATVQRHAPRDYYDIYNIIKNKLPIDMKLVKKKFKDEKDEFSIERIFRRSNKIYNKWESDLLPLTITKPSFNEVMNSLMKFFKYKKK